MRTVRGAFQVILVLMLAAVVRAQAPAAEISGTVRDSSGAVIVGATATLRTSDGTVFKTISTDARGRYGFSAVSPGTYALLVYQDGFAPIKDELRVHGAARLTHDVTLKPASFSEEVTVSASQEEARTALKMDAPVQDIPLSVRSFGNSLVRALDVKDAGELYTRSMTGVNRTGSGAFDAAIRGFGATPGAFNVQTNGLPGFTVRHASQNMENVERVEVLRGPASVLYGRAAPGGLINFVTKRPLTDRQNLFDVRLATFAGVTGGPDFGEANSFRLAADSTGPLGSSRRFLYRLIGAYERNNSYRRFGEGGFVHNQQKFIAPSLTWNISDRTVLTVEGEYRRMDGSYDNGLIAPMNDITRVAPITTVYSEPGDWVKDRGWAVSGHFNKAFGRGWGLNAEWRSVIHHDDRLGLEQNSVLNDNRTVRRRDRQQINTRWWHFLDATITKTVKTGVVSHNLLLGVTAGREFVDVDQHRFNNLGFFVDLLQPVYGLYTRPADGGPNLDNAFHHWVTNQYVQDRIDLGSRWKLLGALRYDRLDIRFDQKRAPSNVGESRPVGTHALLTRRTDAAWVPIGGLVFQPDSRWSLYANVASSFQPPTNPSAPDPLGGSDFKPERGRQFETGVKSVLAGGRVDATLALFQIVKNNVTVPVTPDFSEQIGEERSRGLEVDLRLRPARHFQALCGYAYTDASITNDDRTERIGARLLNTSKHAANFWGRYDVPSGPVKGVGMGLGLVGRTGRAGSLPFAQLTQGTQLGRVLILPGYVRMDAGLYFVRSRYEVTLRVNNLLGEIYYESSFGVVQIRPGRPRDATLSLRFRL